VWRVEIGPNADVEMHQALSGSGAVAELFGWWEWHGDSEAEGARRWEGGWLRENREHPTHQ